MKIGTPFETMYATAQKVWVSLAPNTSSNRMYLSMTGSGSVGAAPAWRQLDISDVSRQKNNGNVTGAVTTDFSLGNFQTYVLTGNVTFTFSNPIFGAPYRIAVAQDATGSRTVTWPGNVKWGTVGAPTLTTTATKTDIFDFQYDGTNFLARTYGLGF